MVNTGILLLTHAPLGQAMRSTLAHIYNAEPEGLEVLDMQPDQDPEDVVLIASEAVMRLDQGNGVLVLTDVLGSTPANCARRLLELGNVAVYAGVNIPMLLKVLNYRSEPLEDMTSMAVSGGLAGIVSLDRRGPRES